jgi:type IV pilus assembly protein PilV
MRVASGFTLAEVLGALLVVAVGLAGAAALQAAALRGGREAARMADGVQLAAALAERMRANPVAMARLDAANPYLQFDYDTAADAPPDADACYGDAACDADQLARFDLMESGEELAARFPGGRIVACRDVPAPDPASGQLAWTCGGQGDGPVAIKLGWRDRAGEAVTPKVLLTLGGGAP